MNINEKLDNGPQISINNVDFYGGISSNNIENFEIDETIYKPNSSLLKTENKFSKLRKLS